MFGDLDIRFSRLGQTMDKDRILDLSFAADDHIDLSATYANSLLDGDQAFTFAAKFAKVAGQAMLTYASGVSTLLLDDDGKADLRIDINGDVTSTKTNLWTGDGGWVL